MNLQSYVARVGDILQESDDFYSVPEAPLNGMARFCCLGPQLDGCYNGHTDTEPGS